jgi:hypothetical protein
MGPPGALLGLPAGLADAPSDAVGLRWALLAVTLAWAALLARGRPWLAWLAGVVFVELVLLFWIASFGRPYGVLVDDEITRVAAETAAAGLGGEEGALAGEPLRRGAATWLARHGLAAERVSVLTTVLPLLTVPALALLVAALPRARMEALFAANLWLAFSTTQAEAVRGAGFLPGLWARPIPSLAVLAVVALTLALGRVRWRGTELALGVFVAGVWAWVPAAGPPPAFADRLLVATVDHAPWLLLGCWGFARGAPGGALALAAGGAAAFLMLPFVRASDTWGAEVLYRVGLVLASAGPLNRILHAVVGALPRGRLWPGALGRLEWTGMAALILAGAPGSFTARWNPGALDPVAFGSRERLSSNLAPVFAWIRRNVPAETSCMASPEYAPMVAVLGQRRVLRAPSLGEAVDDQRRRRAERMLLAGKEGDLLRRYQVGCVVFVDGDQGWLGITTPDQLSRVPGLSLRYADAHARVYGVEPGRSP